MRPSPRKPLGMLAILALITIWGVIVTSAAEQIGRLPSFLQLVTYALAGTIWVVPVRPLLRWMERGQN